jgi:hypothetical protein
MTQERAFQTTTADVAKRQARALTDTELTQIAGGGDGGPAGAGDHNGATVDLKATPILM